MNPARLFLVLVLPLSLACCASWGDPEPQPVEERVAMLHPDDPDLLLNPWDPEGPPLQVRDMDSGRPDYEHGDLVLPDPDKPWEQVRIPPLAPPEA